MTTQTGNRLFPWFVLALVCFLGSYWVTKPKTPTRPQGSPPRLHQEAELEFKKFPPSMCWARKPGEKAWSMGVQLEDGRWALLNTPNQP